MGRSRREVPSRQRDRRKGSQPYQLRCVHRIGRRHRRPIARFGHVLDSQDQPSERSLGKRPRATVQDSFCRHRSTPNRTRPEAVGRRSLVDRYPGSLPNGSSDQRQSYQDHELRCLRRVGRRAGRPASYLGIVGRQNREPGRVGQSWRRNGSQGPASRYRRAEDWTFQASR